MKKKFLSLLTLLCLAVTGAWAQDTETATIDFGQTTYTSLVTISHTDATKTTWSLVDATLGSSSTKAAQSSFSVKALGTSYTTKNSYNSISEISFYVSTTDKGKTYLTVEVSPNEDFSSNITTVQAIAVMNGGGLPANVGNNNQYYKETYTVDDLNGYVRVTVSEASGSSGKIICVGNIAVTYATSTVAPDAPTFSPNGGDVDGGSTVNISGSGTIHYMWSESSTAPTTASEGWTEGTTATVPNVTATKYLYAYASNTVGNSSVASAMFNVTKATLAAGLSFTTTEYKIFSDAGTFDAPTVNNPNNLTGITYTLTGTEGVAIVNSSTGAITLIGGTGTVIVTASVEEQGDYASGNASYTLIVREKPTLTTASDYFWKFSNEGWGSVGTMTENTIADNLEVIASTDSDCSASISSGNQTIDGIAFTKYISFGQVKPTGRQLHIKVAGKSVISVYLKAGGDGRKIKVTKGSKDGDIVGTEQNVSSTAAVYTFNYTDSEDGDLYLYNSGSSSLNFYGIKVEHLSSGPIITTQPVGATYELNETATALTVAATPNTEGKTLSYQWYSNTTNSTENATAISGATLASYTPSTATIGTTYYYCVVSEADNAETTTSNIVAVKVVELGELLTTLQPATTPSGDTAYPSNTFSANGFTLAASNANFWNSVMTPYPRIFKANKDVTITITAPSYATINSIKILGTSNDNNNTASIQAGTGSTAMTSTTLKKRNDYTGSETPELSEVILAVDAPSAGNSISFTTKDQQVRFYVEVYGSGSIPNQTVAATKEYSTYCSSYDLDFTNVEGLEAYVVSKINSNSAAISKVNKVPAGTGLILKKTADIGTASEFTVSVPTSTDDMGTNYLVGVLAEKDMTGVENAYILSNGQFYECSGGTLAAGKAYLVAAAWASSDARTFSLIEEDDETSGIADVRGKKEDVRGDIFDLQGRKVSQPTKGLYIINGKKVAIK